MFDGSFLIRIGTFGKQESYELIVIFRDREKRSLASIVKSVDICFFFNKRTNSAFTAATLLRLAQPVSEPTLKTPLLETSILQVCRQTRRESMHIFYNLNTLAVMVEIQYLARDSTLIRTNPVRVTSSTHCRLELTSPASATCESSCNSAGLRTIIPILGLGLLELIGSAGKPRPHFA